MANTPERTHGKFTYNYNPLIEQNTHWKEVPSPFLRQNHRNSHSNSNPLQAKIIGIRTNNEHSHEFKYWTPRSIHTNAFNKIFHSNHNFDHKYCDYDALLKFKQRLENKGLSVIEFEPNNDCLFKIFAEYKYGNVNTNLKFLELKREFYVTQTNANSVSPINDIHILKFLCNKFCVNIKLYCCDSECEKYFEYNKADSFATVHLAKYNYSMYWALKPYSNFSVQSNNTLFLINKLKHLHQNIENIEDNKDLKRLKDIFEELQSHIPFVIKPRYECVEMCESHNNQSKKVNYLQNIITNNKLNKNENENIRMESEHKNNAKYIGAIQKYLSLNKEKVQITKSETKGLFAKCEIEKFTIIGQYLGVFVLGSEYDSIYGATTHVNKYNLHSFNFKINNGNRDFEIVLDGFRLFEENESNYYYLPFIAMNRCSKKGRANAEYLKCFINDWPAIFVISNRKIGKNEELLSVNDCDSKHCNVKTTQRHKQLNDIQRMKQNIISKYGIK